MCAYRVLLFGKGGQLGSELCARLEGYALFPFSKAEANFLSPDNITALIDQIKPDIIINAAAYTQVDSAEDEREKAFQINGSTVGAISQKAKEINACLIHYSTDFVFDGSKSGPYNEQDIAKPINAYGESKLMGEKLIQDGGDAYLILRTSWVYSMRGNNFLTKVLRWARQNKTLQIVDDQSGSPTWAGVLASATAQLLEHGAEDVQGYIQQHKGLYHLAGKGGATRLAWAKAILANDPQKQEQVVESVLAVKSSAFTTPATRPINSVLDCAKFEHTFGIQIPGWESTLQEVLQSGKHDK